MTTPSTGPAQSPLRFAVMGTGKIAGKVAPLIDIAPGCAVTLVASRDPDRARTFAHQHNFRHAVDVCTYDELAARDDIDAVYITLPNDAHPAWSEKLLRAGKHVLCEKPLTWSRAEAEHLFAVAREHNRILVEAFTFYHAPLIGRTAELVADGAIGTLRRVEAAFDIVIADAPTDNVRYSRALVGGALLDLGCYCIGFASIVTGEDFTEDGAQLHAEAEMTDLYTGSPNDRPNYDGSNAVDGATTITGHTASGVELDLHCSMIKAGGPNGEPLVDAAVHGDAGSILVPNHPRPDHIILRRPGAADERIDDPIMQGEHIYFYSYINQAAHFARAARGEHTPAPSPAWSIHQAAVIEKALAEIGLRYD